MQAESAVMRPQAKLLGPGGAGGGEEESPWSLQMERGPEDAWVSDSPP